MFDHTRLAIWQRAMSLSVAVDLEIKESNGTWPPGLLSQLSRACASIASNIAEAAGQDSSAQSARFLAIATGTTSETQSHLARALGLDLINAARAKAFIDEAGQIRRMIVGFKKWVLQQTPGRPARD